MWKNKNNYLLILILAFAAVLRFWRLGDFPISLNWDEASHGYNAYSILQTGHDEWGKSFPLIFRAFGDYKLPLYIYLTVIPIAIFGLNEFAIRFVSAFSGSLAVLGIYLFTKILLKESKIKIGKYLIPLEIVSAFLLTISPWHFFISRPALEANLALTLIIFAVYFSLRGLYDQKSLIIGSLLFGLSLHTYNTARVFVPLFIISFVYIYKNQLFRLKKIFLPTIILSIFSSIVVWQVFTGEGVARYSKLQILSENAVYLIGENRIKSQLSPLVSRLVYNKPIYFIKTFSKNYLGYFSPQFLYQSTSAQTQFAIPYKNLFTLSVTIIYLIGVYFLFKNIKKSDSQTLLAWLFLSPIAASITADPPQALRPNPMIPVVILIAVYGLYHLTQKMRSLFTLLITVVFMLSTSIAFANYLFNYFTSYSSNYASSWQYGYKQIFEYVDKNASNYDKIFITKASGEPHIFYALYSRLDPQLLKQGLDNIRFEKSNWFWTDKIGKIYFVNDWNIPSSTEAKVLHLESGQDISTKNSLLITTPSRIPPNANFVEPVKYPLGSAAFIITTIK